MAATRYSTTCVPAACGCDVTTEQVPPCSSHSSPCVAGIGILWLSNAALAMRMPGSTLWRSLLVKVIMTWLFAAKISRDLIGQCVMNLSGPLPTTTSPHLPVFLAPVVAGHAAASDAAPNSWSLNEMQRALWLAAICVSRWRWPASTFCGLLIRCE